MQQRTTAVDALAVGPDRAAEMLGIPRTKMYQILASGRVRSVKLGKYRRIPVAEIQAFLQRELDAQSA